MTDKPDLHARDQADAAEREEESLRARWEATQEDLRERFDAPISRATVLTQRTLAWFPVRVWRHFLQHNGFLLAAGVSYQALFATFAGVYVAFAAVGLWLGGSENAINALIELLNSYIPGLIAPEGGVFTPEQVTAIATDSATALGITGAIALGTLLWTAIGFITFARRAVRDIFGLPPDTRGYVLLKARDFLGAFLFALALLLGFAATSIGTWALKAAFDWLGWSDVSTWYQLGARIGSVIISFAIFSGALAALIRFLTGTQLKWRRIWPGALLGGGAITVLRYFTGWLLVYTPTNALLATFAVFIALLLWFRIIGIIMLVAAAWVAVAAKDADVPLIPQSEADRLAAEHQALLVAARVRLRTAQDARDSATWYRAWAADRAVRAAEQELAQVEAAAPRPEAPRDAPAARGGGVGTAPPSSTPAGRHPRAR